MKHKTTFVLTFFFLLVFFAFTNNPVKADSFGINVYGKSYHQLPEWRPRHTINENNYGLGVRFSWGSKNGHHIFTEGGTFKDSFENQAKYISLGFQLRLFWQVRVGVNTALYSTRSIGVARTVVAPLPLLSIDFPIVTLNAIYLPPHKTVNPYKTFGFYATVRLSESGK